MMVDARTQQRFDEMVEALRDVQELVSATAPPSDVIADLTRQLQGVADSLRAHVAPEDSWFAGTLFDVPGRGQGLVPVLHIDEHTPRARSGRVTFGRFYFGSRSAIHAGAIPLAFSELLGWLSTEAAGTSVRTAFLHVDYRSPTPVGQELRIAGWVHRDEGRKWYLRGELHAGDRLCAQAEALYIASPAAAQGA